MVHDENTKEWSPNYTICRPRSRIGKYIWAVLQRLQIGASIPGSSRRSDGQMALGQDREVGGYWPVNCSEMCIYKKLVANLVY